MIALKELFERYKNYIATLEKINTSQKDEFLDWLKNYINYKVSEKSFDSNYLPRYVQGQVVLVNFGVGIGKEFSYPHY